MADKQNKTRLEKELRSRQQKSGQRVGATPTRPVSALQQHLASKSQPNYASQQSSQLRPHFQVSGAPTPFSSD